MAGQAINFYRLPNEFNKMREYNGIKITRTSKDVFEVIWALCEGGKRIYKTAISKIAELAACCEKSVYNAINVLEKAGLIIVKHGGNKRMLDEFQVHDILEYKEEKIDATVKNTEVKRINNNYTNISLSTTLPSSSSRKVDNQTNNDFEILKKDPAVDQRILEEIRKYYFTIINTQKEFYLIQGQKVSREMVITKIKSLNYVNFKNIASHIKAMKTNTAWTMRSSFAFFLTCFINEVEGITPICLKATKKSNSFFSFTQREIDFDELAKKVFKN